MGCMRGRAAVHKRRAHLWNLVSTAFPEPDLLGFRGTNVHHLKENGDPGVHLYRSWLLLSTPLSRAWLRKKQTHDAVLCIATWRRSPSRRLPSEDQAVEECVSDSAVMPRKGERGGYTERVAHRQVRRTAAVPAVHLEATGQDGRGTFP